MTRLITWFREQDDPKPLQPDETVVLRGAGAITRADSGFGLQGGVLVLTSQRLWLRPRRPWPLKARPFKIPLALVDRVERTGKRSLLDPFPGLERIRIETRDGQAYLLQTFKPDEWISRINELKRQA